MPKIFRKKSTGDSGDSNTAAAVETVPEVGVSETAASVPSRISGGESHQNNVSEESLPRHMHRPIKMDNKSNGSSNESHEQDDIDIDESAKTAKADNSSESNGVSPPAPVQGALALANNNNNMNSRPIQQSTFSNFNPELDASEVNCSYERVPLLDVIELPRGGVSIETSAVGFVQFGIPPETIKDSMNLGLDVPSVYIVPVDRFCRDMGPALGVNLAEFEFPAYFNFFVRRKRCTLIVDSNDAERNIRKVFNETLLGPAQFRDNDSPLSHAEEDFAPEFPREAIPDFYRELKHFRIMPNGEELVLETLLKFCHFETAPDMNFRDNLGAPPKNRSDKVEVERVDSASRGDGDHIHDEQTNNENGGSNEGDTTVVEDENNEESGTAGTVNKKNQKSLPYSQIRWIGDVAKIYPDNASNEDIANNKCKRVEVFKMPSGTDYVIHDIDETNTIVGKARFSGHVKVTEGISVMGFDTGDEKESENKVENISLDVAPPTFHPPSFGVTVLGNSHGFDKNGSTSGYVLWINGRGIMIDPPPYSSATLEREGIRPRLIVGIIITHCHADHDAGAFQKVLTGSPVVVIATPTIYKSFIRKYAALSSLSPALLRHCHRFKPAIIGEPLRFQGAIFHFIYTLHSIPCVGFRVEWRGRSMVFTGDHFNNPPALATLVEKGVLSKARETDLNNLPMQETDLLLHEAGAPPIHTPLDVLLKLPQKVKDRLYVVHTSTLPEGCELRAAPTGTSGTIRLDRIRRRSVKRTHDRQMSIFEISKQDSLGPLVQEVSEYAESELFTPTTHQYSHLLGDEASAVTSSEPPLVSLRPTSSSDAWFILNLLCAVPFLSR